MELSNRMIRTASHEGLADSRGRPSGKQFEFYRGFITDKFRAGINVA